MIGNADLFKLAKLREIARKLHQECSLECEHPDRDLAKLKLWRNNLHKIRDFLAPAQFDVVFTLDFHKYDFNWFDLIRRA